MLKMDLNLKKMRHELVPEVITEDDFWLNYFYKIELCKKELGLSTCRLGQRIAVETRARQLKARRDDSSEGEYDDEEVAQSQATLKQAKGKRPQQKQPAVVEMKTISTGVKSQEGQVKEIEVRGEEEDENEDGDDMGIDVTAETEAYMNQNASKEEDV